MSEEFGYTVRKIDRVDIVSVVGDLDLHTLSAIETQLQALINRGSCNIVLDLSRTEFLSSTAVGIILEKHGRMNARHGKLMIACLSVSARDTIEALALDKVIHVYETVEDALSEAV